MQPGSGHRQLHRTTDLTMAKKQGQHQQSPSAAKGIFGFVSSALLLFAMPVVNAQTAPSTSTQSGAKCIVLKPGWDTPMQGGSRTHKDLSVVLNGFATASADVAFVGDIDLFQGVKYLMPLEDAVKVLGIKQRSPSAKRVVCPGFPRDTLNYVSYDGLFDGAFNRIDIVTDMANQVVTLQIVDETPKDAGDSSDTEGENTYNFVGYRVKAVTSMKVRFRPDVYSKTFDRWRKIENWSSSPKGDMPKVLRVESYLLERSNRRLETVRWFVPRPFANLIFHCIKKAQ